MGGHYIVAFLLYHLKPFNAWQGKRIFLFVEGYSTIQQYISKWTIHSARKWNVCLLNLTQNLTEVQSELTLLTARSPTFRGGSLLFILTDVETKKWSAKKSFVLAARESCDNFRPFFVVPESIETWLIFRVIQIFHWRAGWRGPNNCNW